MLRPTGPRTVVALTFLAALFLQVAWVIAVPPYRGMDEPDHAYRAEAVASGRWSATRQAPGYVGRGDLVRVSATTVRAAYATCRSYSFIADADCRPARTFSDGTVLVASGAAGYFPGYYAAVGLPTRWLPPVPALYAMRLIDLLVCSSLVALAAWGTTLWSRTSWPLLGVMLAFTPQIAYQGSTPAPNGPEICAGMALWSLGLALRHLDARDASVDTVLVAALLPVGMLGLLRSLGPLWLSLVLVTLVLATGPAQWRRVLGAHRSRVVLLATAAAVSVIAGMLWTWAQAANSMARLPSYEHANVVGHSFLAIPLWVAQSIGTFPDKAHFGPYVMYAVAVTTWLFFLVTAWRHAGGLDRSMLLMVIVVSFAIPLAFTLRTYEAFGPVWQGKYGWPYTCGLFLIAGTVLDRSRRSPSRAQLTIATMGALMLVHLPGPVTVVLDELAARSKQESVSWLVPYPGLVAGCVVLGCLSWLLAAVTATASTAGPGVDHEPSVGQPDCAAVVR